MINFIIGLITGSIITLIIMCCIYAGREDKWK